MMMIIVKYKYDQAGSPARASLFSCKPAQQNDNNDGDDHDAWPGDEMFVLLCDVVCTKGKKKNLN